MKCVSCATIILGVCLFSDVTMAHGNGHIDIRPYIVSGQIATGTAELQGNVVVPLSDDRRVFGSELGEDDPAQPFFTEDPGFLSEDGAFPGGTGHFVGFDATAGLGYWTGSGFGPAPSLESLQITHGSQSVNVGADPTAGFYFGQISLLGGLHSHLSFELYGADSNPIPGDGVEPSPGIYLLEMRLKTTMSGVADSLPLWIVFNNGDLEMNHELALEWVEANLVPEPGSGLLMMSAALGAAIWRRRKS